MIFCLDKWSHYSTSNHFKVDILRSVGYWDPYNVTEDADLGIRLYSHGYKVHMIDSYTLEESPITIDNWMNQRARWIKGFIQTFCVFLSNKSKDTKLTYCHRITIYILIGISSYSFYCMTFVLLKLVLDLNPIINYLWFINSFLSLFYLCGTAFYILSCLRGRLRNFKMLDILGIIFWPFYFILHVIASYIAIWETITKPFKWNKTKHGVSLHED